MVCIRKSRKKKVLVQKLIRKTHIEGEERITGAIRIGGISFDFRMFILAPYFDWEKRKVRTIVELLYGKAEAIEHVRSHYFQFLVYKNGETLVLTTEEYAFFARLILPFAEIFFNREETRSLDVMKREMQKVGIPVLGGASTQKSSGYTTITSREMEFLRSLKFGCKFEQML